uniref:Rho guanine nucleotide exchange factor 26 n=1 Tax=Cyprinus carpio TaxID=7962 RepID=A0A8C2FYG8_CYPCA
MDLGNEVDLSNNNIIPLWKRLNKNDMKSKPRPLSYQIDGVLMTDFPVDDMCSFTLTQPAEKISTTVSNTTVLKHTLNKPMRKTRVVRSISIGYLSNGQFSLSKFSKSDDEKDEEATSSPKTTLPTKNGNGLSDAHGSPVDLRSSPSHSSTSSIPSISSNLSLPSDPPTPCTTSPAERPVGVLLQRQSSESPQGLEGKRPTSPIILSTHSPAAQKSGTQQIIPRALVSDTRLSKPSQMFLNTGKSAYRPRSMFETGSSFSTSKEDELDGDENTGHLTRGQRSKSYRRAMVSGVDIDVPSLDPKAKRLSQPVLKGVAEERLSCKLRLTSSKKKKKKKTFGSAFPFWFFFFFFFFFAEPKHPQPDESIVVQYKPIRTSWSQLSVAIFEVISSEHSYLHSLEILVRLFKNSNELSEIINKTDHHHLFSNIVDVCEASKKFFKELEDRHQQNIVINDISDIVLRHAQSNFDPYVTYCSNETICQKTPKDSASYEACKKALHVVSKLVRKCNEGARTMERTEMMYTINSQLEFKIKPFPLVSSSRWMVKRGELTAFVEENGIFSKRTSRQHVYFFLFNDVLIVTRKKSEESYTVIDYALRDQIYVGSCQAEDLNLSPVRSTAGMLTSRQNIASHLFQVRFRSNHSGYNVTMILGVELLNERARWISALGQNSSNDKNDRMNSMQVEVTRTYTARQPDELSLQVADVVLVSQTVDGWYEGERLRDGERGWFLAECAELITCQATIEKNMQRMDRLQDLETNV